MSLRALGRQFQAQRANRDRPWQPGTERHPQGTLFDQRQGGQFPIHTPQTKEALRRQASGERNPEAPWKQRWLQWAFPPPGTKTYTQGKLDL